MRDKIISLRVDSTLLTKFENIVKSKTKTEVYYGKKIIYYEGVRDGKYSIADLLESALLEYIKNNT